MRGHLDKLVEQFLVRPARAGAASDEIVRPSGNRAILRPDVAVTNDRTAVGEQMLISARYRKWKSAVSGMPWTRRAI